MVERRVSDGKRVGQLLASELEGLSVGVLDAVSVVDADADATPSEEGTEAYRVAHDGTVVASVWLHPEHAAVRLHGERAWPDSEATDRTDGPTADETDGPTADGTDGPTADETTVLKRADSLRVESGAGVKRAVDAFRAVLARTDGE
jgi:hypothetical protein